MYDHSFAHTRWRELDCLRGRLSSDDEGEDDTMGRFAPSLQALFACVLVLTDEFDPLSSGS